MMIEERDRGNRKITTFCGKEAEVKLASRSRKGYWRMSGNSVVQCALTNRWLIEQGVPDMRAKWVALHYPDQVQDV